MDTKAETITGSKRKGMCIGALTALVLVAGLWIILLVIAPSVRYHEAEEAYADGDYRTAISIYKGLADYKDSSKGVQSAISAYADSLFENGDYRSAIEYYEQLTKRPDEEIRECHYRLMLAAMEEQDWEQAEAEYNEAMGYRDADEQCLRILIGKAEKLVEEGDYIAADELLYSVDEDEVLALKMKASYLVSVGYYEGSSGQYQDFGKAARGFYALLHENEYADDAKAHLYECAVKLYEDPSSRVQAISYLKSLGSYRDAKKYLSRAVGGSPVSFTLENLQGTWQCMEENRFLITLTIDGDSASVSNLDTKTGDSGYFWDCDGSACVVHLYDANTNGYLNPQIMVDEANTGINCACLLVRKVASTHFTTANSEIFYKIA